MPVVFDANGRPIPADILVVEDGLKVMKRVSLLAVTVIDEHDVSGPDVDPKTGDERQTTGLDGEPL